MRIARGRLQSVLGLASQLVNAGTNVASVYIASFLLTPSGFGSFVFGFAAVALVLATGRGLIGGTMLAQLPSVTDASERERVVRSAFGFTVLVGLGGTAALLVVALWTPAVVWFAPWLTVALAHDVARHVRTALGDRASSLLIDVVWALAQGAVLLGLWLAGGPLTVPTLAAAWGVGAIAGLSVFVVRSRARVRPADPRLWVRATRDIAGWFTAICVLGQLELYLVLVLAGLLLSEADAGGLRAVQLLVFQPPLVLGGALITLITPGIVRAAAGAAPLGRIWARGILAVTPIAGAVLLVAAFGHWFMAAFFAQYTAFAGLVLPVALQAVGSVFAAPTSAMLMGTRRGRLEFVVHSGRTTLVVGAAAAGAVLGGAEGLAWGLAAGSLTTLAVMTLVALRELRRGALTVAPREVAEAPAATPGADAPGAAVPL